MSNISPLMNGRLSPPSDYSFMLEATLKRFENERKCACPLAEKYTYFFEAVKTLPTKDSAELHNLTRVATPSVSTPKLTLWARILQFFGRSDDESYASSSGSGSRRDNAVKYEDRYRIPKSVPEECEQMAKFAVKKKMDKATWEQIYKAYQKDWYTGGKFQMMQYEPWIERATVYDYDGLIARTKMEINFLKKMHVKRMANYERAVAARKLAFEKAVSSRIVNGISSNA